MKIGPKVRNEAKVDLHGALHGAIAGAIGTMFTRTDIYPFKNCLNCLHFVEISEQCRQYHTRPPAKVICYGCDFHEDINKQEISF